MKRYLCAAVALLLGALGSAGAPVLPVLVPAGEAPNRKPHDGAEFAHFYSRRLVGHEKFVRDCIKGKRHPFCHRGFPLTGVWFAAALVTTYLLFRCFLSLTSPTSPNVHRLLSAAEGESSRDSCGPSHPQQQHQQQQLQGQQGQKLWTQVQKQFTYLSVSTEVTSSLTSEEQQSVSEALKLLRELHKEALHKANAANAFQKSLHEDREELRRQRSLLQPGEPDTEAIAQLAADISGDMVLLQKYTKDAVDALDRLRAVAFNPSQYGWKLLHLAERQVQQLEKQQVLQQHLQQQQLEQPDLQQQQSALAAAADAVVAASIVLGFQPPPLVMSDARVRHQVDRIANRHHDELKTWERVLKQPSIIDGPQSALHHKVRVVDATIHKSLQLAMGLEQLQLHQQAHTLRELCSQVDNLKRSVEREHQKRVQQDKRRRERMQQRHHALELHSQAYTAAAQLTATVERVVAGPPLSLEDSTQLESLYLRLANDLKNAEGLHTELLRGTAAGQRLAEAIAAAAPQMKPLTDFFYELWAESLTKMTLALSTTVTALTSAHAELEEEAKDPAAAEPQLRPAGGAGARAFSPTEEKALTALQEVLALFPVGRDMHKRLLELIMAYKPERSLVEKLQQLQGALDTATATAERVTELLLYRTLVPLDNGAAAEAHAKKDLRNLEKQHRDTKAAGKTLSKEDKREKERLEEIVEAASGEKRAAARKVTALLDVFKILSMPQQLIGTLHDALTSARSPLFHDPPAVPALRDLKAADAIVNVRLPATRFLGLRSAALDNVERMGDLVHPPAATGGAAAVATGYSEGSPMGTLRGKTREGGQADGSKSPTGSISSLLSLLGNPAVEDGSSLFELSLLDDRTDERKVNQTLAPATAAPPAQKDRALGQETRKRTDSASRKTNPRRRIPEQGAAGAAAACGENVGEDHRQKGSKGLQRWWSQERFPDFKLLEARKGSTTQMPMYGSLGKLQGKDPLKEGTLEKTKSLDSSFAQSVMMGGHSSLPRPKKQSTLRRAFSHLSPRRWTGSTDTLRAKAASATAKARAAKAAAAASEGKDISVKGAGMKQETEETLEGGETGETKGTKKKKSHVKVSKSRKSDQAGTLR